MSNAAFDTAIRFILSPLRDGHRDDRAPGEKFMTNQGITDMTWTAAVRRGIVTGNLVDMTDSDRDAVYRGLFWTPLQCDSFHPAVAVTLFSDATLVGPRAASICFQKAIRTLPVDGVIGRKTIAAANAMQPAALVDRMVNEDLRYLLTLTNSPQFIRGWTARQEALRTLGHTLAHAAT